MWSVPHRIVTHQLNSYTLETLNSDTPLGVYNSRRLRAFKPCEGTRLAMNELARLVEEDLDLEGGVAEVDSGFG
jgi:hypothetical protein